MAAVASADRPPPFQVVDLGRLGFVHEPGGQLAGTASPSVPGTFDVNNKDQVAYAQLVDHPTHGPVVRPALFTLRPDYGLMGTPPFDIIDTFGPAGAIEGVAMDINDAGVIVGQLGGTSFFEGNAHVWILDPFNPSLAQSISLDLPPGTSWSRAVSVSESAPWTVVVQTGSDERCPLECANGGTQTRPHVVTYSVTVTAGGVVSAPVWFSSDADCENSIAAWAVGPGAGGYVGSDVRLSDGACPVGPGSACGDDQSGLRWSSPATLVDLIDYDGAAGDTQPSEGRDIGVDGYSVGWTIESNSTCFSRAVLWDPSGQPALSGGLGTLALAPLGDVGAPPAIDPAPALDNRSRTWAEGLNDGLERTVVGWDEELDRPTLWYETGLASPAWEAMFPGSNAPGLGVTWYSPGSVVAASCEIFAGLDALVYFLYDVNERESVVGRAAVSDLDTATSPDLHLVLLVPQPRCSGDVDRDGDVDLFDLLEVLALWDPAGCTNCVWCPGDIDGDRLVGFSDLVIVLSEWGNCIIPDGPPQSVQDCWERYGSDLTAFEACIQSLATQ